MSSGSPMRPIGMAAANVSMFSWLAAAPVPGVLMPPGATAFTQMP